MRASQFSRKGQPGMSQRKAALPTQRCEEACPRLLRRNPGTGRTPGLSSGHSLESCMGRPVRLGKPCPSYCTNETVWEGRQCSQRLQTSGGWITYTQKTPPPHCHQEQGATRINHIHRQTKRGSDIPEQKTWWKGTIKLCEKPSSKEIVETEQYFEIYIIHILWWVHNKIRIADVKKEPGYKK